MQNTSKRCFTTRAPDSEPPLFQSGRLVLQPHDIGWIISGVFTLIATIVSGWLIFKHLVWFTNKNQQRYIVRLLFMVPIYAIVSLASYIFWNHSVPLTLIRDTYESFVIYCFFYLLLEYLAPTAEGQKDAVRKAKLQKWLFPMGFVKYRPRDGLYFLQLMKWGILQYCIIRPGTTIAAVVLDFIGLYCEDSWSFRWGHVYITVLVSLSVTVAMYCLLQFYATLASELAPHRPLLKFLSIKSVVFLTFWQVTLLSVLATFGLMKGTPTMTSDAIQNGIATILETIEMSIFAVVHLKAFPYMDYAAPGLRTSPWQSLRHVLNIRELWNELIYGSDYMGKTIRGIETDGLARRRLHFVQVMGRERDESLLRTEENSDDEEYSSKQLEDSRFHNHRSYLGDDEKRYDFVPNSIPGLDSVTRQHGKSPRFTSKRPLPVSSQTSEVQNNGANKFVIRPTEMYNVPLEKEVALSLHEKQDLPNVAFMAHSSGTRHFLANAERPKTKDAVMMTGSYGKLPKRGPP